jgi:hypothetical protein
MASLGQFHQCFTSSFCARRSQNCKKERQLDCLYTLLGSAPLKAAHRTLMKLAPYVPCKHIYKKFKRTKKYFPKHTITTRVCETSLFAYEIIRRRKKNLYHKNILKIEARERREGKKQSETSVQVEKRRSDESFKTDDIGVLSKQRHPKIFYEILMRN